MSLSSSSLNWKVRRELQLQRQQWWAELSNAPTSIILSIHLVILPSLKLLRLEWSSRPWKHSGTHFPNPLVLEVTKSLGWNGIDCCFSKWKVKFFHVYVYVVFRIWISDGKCHPRKHFECANENCVPINYRWQQECLIYRYADISTLLKISDNIDIDRNIE